MASEEDLLGDQLVDSPTPTDQSDAESSVMAGAGLIAATCSALHGRLFCQLPCSLPVKKASALSPQISRKFLCLPALTSYSSLQRFFVGKHQGLGCIVLDRSASEQNTLPSCRSWRAAGCVLCSAQTEPAEDAVHQNLNAFHLSLKEKVHESVLCVC